MCEIIGCHVVEVAFYHSANAAVAYYQDIFIIISQDNIIKCAVYTVGKLKERLAAVGHPLSEIQLRLKKSIGRTVLSLVAAVIPLSETFIGHCRDMKSVGNVLCRLLRPYHRRDYYCGKSGELFGFVCEPFRLFMPPFGQHEIGRTAYQILFVERRFAVS